MTEYVPRSGQNPDHLFDNPSHTTMSHYSNQAGVNFVYANDHNHIQYPSYNNSYLTYPASFVPSQNPSTAPIYLPSTASMAVQYSHPTTASTAVLPEQMSFQTVPSQARSSTQTLYLGHGAPLHRHHSQPTGYSASIHDAFLLTETESQDSVNSHTMMSEDVSPRLEGYPDVKQFDDLMKRYVQDLSPKKQDKALIHARRAQNIKTVLIDKKTTSVESAQFRFWVKKMFTLLPNDPNVHDKKKKICHEGKPVAVREKLFKILIRAHKQCQHGGRDKTSAQVRKVYSWVPKELISRFVKLCPTCQIRRGTTRPLPPRSPRCHADRHAPQTISPPQSRAESIATRQSSVRAHSPVQLNFGPAFQSQNRWMSSIQPARRSVEVQTDSTEGTPVSSFTSIPSSSASTSSAYGQTSLRSTNSPYSVGNASYGFVQQNYSHL